MEGVKSYKGLILTISDDEEVMNLSDNSDIEMEFQPSKQSAKKNKHFTEDFQFVSSLEEYNKDSWNDIKKYVKRKAKSKTDDKINKRLSKESSITNTAEENDNNHSDDLEKLLVKQCGNVIMQYNIANTCNQSHN